MNTPLYACTRIGELRGLTATMCVRYTARKDPCTIATTAVCDEAFTGALEFRPHLEQAIELLASAWTEGFSSVHIWLGSTTITGVIVKADGLSYTAAAFPSGSPVIKSLGRTIRRAWTSKRKEIP